MLAAIAPVLASARGSVRIEQIDGSVKTYAGVHLRLSGGNLHIGSADGRGTLEVSHAACSYVGALQRCLPYALVLRQDGAHRITFDRGTIYFNLTDTPQPLPHSSKTVPPNGVLALLKTKRGTYISIAGRLDEVTK